MNAVIARYKYGPGHKVINLTTPQATEEARKIHLAAMAAESKRIFAQKPVDAKLFNVIAAEEQEIKNLTATVARASFAYQKSVGSGSTSLVDMKNHPDVKRLAELQARKAKRDAEAAAVMLPEAEVAAPAPVVAMQPVAPRAAAPVVPKPAEKPAPKGGIFHKKGRK